MVELLVELLVEPLGQLPVLPLQLLGLNLPRLAQRHLRHLFPQPP